jgi:Helicase conserved C-terminal domain/SNF2-related domain
MAANGAVGLRDVLSRLTYQNVKKLLGSSCDRLLRDGGRQEIDLGSQLKLDDRRFTLNLGESIVTIRFSADRFQKLDFRCSTCPHLCEHLGAAFSLILEEKLALGLSAPPPEDAPLETLTEEQLITRALAERAERSRKERMALTPLNGKALWSDYAVTSSASGKTYRVALRGWDRGESYCSCPDFRTNTLGTCKHLIFALRAVKRRFPKSALSRSYRRSRLTLHVRYGETPELRLLLPEHLEPRAETIAGPLRDAPIKDLDDLLSRIRALERAGHPVNIYPDAEEMMNGLLQKSRLESLTSQIRQDPKNHRLRSSLLKIPLLPYQLDGIAFAVSAGRAKTARVIKGLASPFALVLSGTPLENRLEELYSVVQFINARQLGPAFRFFHRHRVVDEKGKLIGYRNLDELRRSLGPVLLRRTRSMVLRQLPPRTTEILRIPPSAEQADMHDGYKRTISTILAKKYISEMDLLRLQKALLMCRMAADSTFLVDKEPPGYSTKLAELDSLLERLVAEPERKVIVFSEWTTMLDLIEPLLSERTREFVRLDGSVPQVRRQDLVNRFQRNPECAFFLATNAGATGLNLQAADTVVNVDLPWNPAVLEQRIARAHRMGQKRPVQVYIMVTEATIEENMLSTISAKRDLAMAALDPDATAKEVALAGGIDELKRRLEVLMGEKPPAPVDESDAVRVGAGTEKRRESVASAGGELLSAAFRFMGELLGSARQEANGDVSQARSQAQERMKRLLSECMERTDDGGWRMSVKFQDAAAVDTLARVLARLSES